MVIVRIDFKQFSSVLFVVLELEDERIQIPLQCIRILLHSIRMLLPASAYPRYNRFNFTISYAISCLIRCDSLYGFLNHIIILIGLISKHYTEFLIVFIEFYFDYSLLFAILSCRHSDTIFQYPDSLNAYPNALQSI